MIEYGIEVARLREENKQVEIFNADFQVAKGIGFVDPPMGTEVGVARVGAGPIERGVFAAMNNASTLRPENPTLQVVQAIAVGASLKSLTESGLIDQDPGPKDLRAA